MRCSMRKIPNSPETVISPGIKRIWVDAVDIYKGKVYPCVTQAYTVEGEVGTFNTLEFALEYQAASVAFNAAVADVELD